MLATEAKDNRQAQALGLLQAWTVPSTDSAARGHIHMAWYMQLGPAIFQDDLSKSLYEEMSNRAHPTFLADIMAQTDNPWCDNVRSFPAENCAAIAQEALDTALDDSRNSLGRRHDQMAVGGHSLHLLSPQPFYGSQPAQPHLRPQISPTAATPTRSTWPPCASSLATQQRWVPSYRHLVDMGDLNASLFMHYR